MAAALMATPLMAAGYKKDIDPDDATKGSITYKMGPETPKGIFVVTYYFRDTDCIECQNFKGQDAPWTKTDVYKAGILQYLKVTESPAFAGWKLVIYTDALSLENPIFRGQAQKHNTVRYDTHVKQWNEIKSHPNTVFAVVDWPEYAVGKHANNKTVDNAILRAIRMKAFYDFPELPVFVRDADTLFENIVKRREIGAELALWEQTFKDELTRIVTPPSQYRMVIASQPNYHRQWHVHPETGVNTTGCYAAITSSLGGIPEWTDGSLWRKCLAYLRKYSKVVANGVERKPNNIDKPTYIGKDEQLLSYVVLPAIFDKIYFYYFEYIQVEGTKIVPTGATPFAAALIQKGYDRYPSPYKNSLSEPELPLEQSVGVKRKDENEKTEMTLLNPKIIAASLSPKTHDVLKVVFQHFMDKIELLKPMSGGGPLRRRKPRTRHRARRQRPRASTRTQRRR
jgi:hypothetical protein